MLLQPLAEPFNSEDYLHEIKYNGIRAIYTKDLNTEDFYTRHKTNISSKYPEVLNLDVPNQTVLDGELVCLQRRENGREIDNFSRIMERFRYSKEEKIIHAAETNPATFMVFDVMVWNGVSLVKEPLIERKKILANEFIEKDHVQLVSYRLFDGLSLFKEAIEYEREGIVSKRLSSPYLVAKRSSKGDWFKIINWTYLETFIHGYRKDKFGLLCTVIDEFSRKTQRVGIVEFGMKPEQKKAFYQIVKQLIIGEDKDFIYLEPVIRCKLKGRGFTENGYLFTPVFVDFILYLQNCYN
jgi:DNA ligase-1